MTTRGQWSILFAAALGNTNPSPSLVNWISAWTAKENTKALFNPLATTYDLPPNSNFNYAGVKNYATQQQGIEATVKTLRGDHPGYADIVAGIVNNNPQQAADGLKGAPWGTNGSAVEILWRNTDVRDQELLSEPVGQSRIVPPSKFTLENNTAGTVVTETPAGQTVVTSPETGGARTITHEPAPGASRRITYIAGGSLLLLLAVGLAVKTYVPVTQIVKTVGAVAA